MSAELNSEKKEEYKQFKNTILNDLKNIFDQRKELYNISPISPEIKINFIKEKCSFCPVDHDVIEITGDFILGEEILDLCIYTKKNNLPMFFGNNSFKIIIDE